MFVVMLRTAILFTLVVLSIRLMGKRQVGQLQPFELAVLIMISALAAIPMEDIGIPLFNSIIPILLLFSFQVFLSLGALKSEKFRSAVSGRPSILVENGKIVESELKHLMININDLLEQLRIGGYYNLADIEFAIFETNGDLSIIPKSQNRPVTPRDLKIDTHYEGIPYPLIVDGNINKQNLQRINLDESWLKTELANFGINNIRNVLLATLDTEGRLLFQEKSAKEKTR